MGKTDVARLIKDCGLPVYEAEFLLMELLSVDRKQLYAAELSEEIISSFNVLVEKRKEHFPLQYLVGVAYFYGYKFKVVPGVFIPRPETEVLVDLVLDFIGKSKKKRRFQVLDVGCGCGNISLSLACESDKVIVDGIDISSLAIMISSENSRDLKQISSVKGEVRFILGDFMEITSHSEMSNGYDIVVSNPPYLDFGIYKSLPGDVKKEPPVALFASEGGNFFYRLLFDKCRKLMKKDGVVFVELPGEDNRTSKICELARGFGWKVERVSCDLNERDRVLMLRR